MNRIREFCIRNRIYITIFVFLLATLAVLTQIKILDYRYLNFIYQPYLVKIFGASFAILLLWIITIICSFLFYPKIFYSKKAKLLFLLPLLLIFELSSILSFLKFNPDGTFPLSYGGLLGEFIIKWPISWDRFNPSTLDYFLGISRFALINLVILSIIFPFSAKNISAKILNSFLSLIKSLSKKSKLRNNSEEEIPDKAISTPDIKEDPEKIRLNFYEKEESTPQDSRLNGDGMLEENNVVSHTFTPNINKSIEWKLPKKEILATITSEVQSESEINAKKELIEKTLSEHGIEVSVDQVKSGPSVTMYGLSPGYGNSKRVRVDHILAREKDLALALASQNIRFQSPVPGESLVGIEIPNQKPTLVGIKELIYAKKNEKEFEKFTLPIALGTGTDNQSLYCDLTKLPHLLVAGATGSGKSVCINSIISGFLLKKNPDEVRFIMIDPKRVELTPYSGIPHLLTNPIVESPDAIKALKLMIEEMTFRFKQLEADNSKNISSYNQKSTNKNRVKMPYIVIVVDELADLMLSSSNEVEKLLVRLAQLGRATGIHLIVATQRPSVDVVTGLIKANFPSRISFSVTSQIDSRTIIDMPGAEKLLGKGDMLFVPIDNPSPKRAQGILISDKEIDSIVDHWKNHKIYNPLKTLDLDSYVDTLTENESEINSEDELFIQAQNLARGQRTLSTSYLQRRLRIGYPRAARLMDELESQGIVGAGDAGKAREVF